MKSLIDRARTGVFLKRLTLPADTFLRSACPRDLPFQFPPSLEKGLQACRYNRNAVPRSEVHRRAEHGASGSPGARGDGHFRPQNWLGLDRYSIVAERDLYEAACRLETHLSDMYARNLGTIEPEPPSL